MVFGFWLITIIKKQGMEGADRIQDEKREHPMIKKELVCCNLDKVESCQLGTVNIIMDCLFSLFSFITR